MSSQKDFRIKHLLKRSYYHQKHSVYGFSVYQKYLKGRSDRNKSLKTRLNQINFKDILEHIFKFYTHMVIPHFVFKLKNNRSLILPNQLLKEVQFIKTSRIYG